MNISKRAILVIMLLIVITTQGSVKIKEYHIVNRIPYYVHTNAKGNSEYRIKIKDVDDKWYKTVNETYDVIIDTSGYKYLTVKAVDGFIKRYSNKSLYSFLTADNYIVYEIEEREFLPVTNFLSSRFGLLMIILIIFYLVQSSIDWNKSKYKSIATLTTLTLSIFLITISIIAINQIKKYNEDKNLQRLQDFKNQQRIINIEGDY